MGPREGEDEPPKHGVSFAEGATGRVIIAAYTVRRTADGETIRIISARQASRRERRAYAAGGPVA